MLIIFETHILFGKNLGGFFVTTTSEAILRTARIIAQNQNRTITNRYILVWRSDTFVYKLHSVRKECIYFFFLVSKSLQLLLVAVYRAWFVSVQACSILYYYLWRLLAWTTGRS